MGLAVGIDLGTTNSVVAISQGGRPRVLAAPDGSLLIPSVVSFHPNGQTIVGAEARVRRPIDPTNTVFSVKRLLGRAYQSEEVRRAKSRFAFELREGPDAAVLVHTRIGDLSLPEISAYVLREIRRIGETALGEPIDRAVVTVPANFNELQRTATKVAGQIADLDVIRILNEPTAAALAYGYGRGSRERVAVYDFGGGTFDVTLLELSGNVFEVLATAGDTFLGGDDIDLLVTENLADALLRAHRIDARQDHRSYELLRAAAEQAKIDLSSTDTATIRIPEIGYAPGGRPLEFRARITRAELEALSAPLVNRTFEVCAEALKLAQMKPSDCNTVILVGGSSRIPAVRDGVTRYFGRDPLTTLPPEQVVGMGAAILAEALTGTRKPGGAAVAPRSRTATLKPPGSVAAPSPSQPPGPAVSPARPFAPGTRVPTTPPRGPTGSVRPTTGPAIRPRPTDEQTTNAILARGRAGTNPGIAPGAAASDLSWGSNRPPPGTTPGSGETTNALRAPPPGLTVTDPSMLDVEPTSTFDAPAIFGGDERTRPRAQPLATTLKDIPPALLPPLDFDAADDLTLPGVDDSTGVVSRPIAPQPVGTRTNPAPAAPPPPDDFAIPRAPGTPGDSLFTAIPGAIRTAGPLPTAAALQTPTNPFAPAPSMPPGRAPGGAFAPAPSPQPPAFASPGPSLRQNTVAGPYGLPGPSPRGNTNAPGVPPRTPAGAIASPGPSQHMPSAPMVVPPIAAPGPSQHTGTAPLMAAPGPSQQIPSAPMMSPFGATNASPGPSQRMPASQMPSWMPGAPSQAPMPPGARPGSAPPGAMPGAPLTGNTGMRNALGDVHARAPSMPPGQLGLPSFPPPALPLLLDVTPFTLSVETIGGLCETVIPRNATIPVEQTREFATAVDNQETVRIRIAQGESRRFGENQALGELELSGITRASRGDVKIAVIFELDADGTLQVRAREIATGRETRTRVTLLTMPTAGDTAAMAQRQRTQA